MKDLEKINLLFDVAESINYHLIQLNALKVRQLKYNSQGLFMDGVDFKRNVSIYERLLRILNNKYNRILKELK